MQAGLRTFLGITIITIFVGSAITMGLLLPQSSVNNIEVINDRLDVYGKLTEDDFNPFDGSGENSEWMYTGGWENNSLFYDQAFFEFFNVSDRTGFLDYGNAIAYYFVQGDLVFDIITNKTILEYDIEGDYVTYAYRKQYLLNTTASDLTGEETVLNFNYMWPYYISEFGNGTEYGFQAYVASFLLQQELLDIKGDPVVYSDSELAYAALNRTYAEEEGLIDLGIYLPHNWLSVRPAYLDLDFDQATSNKILYNAQYNGHDYSVLTGESGSAKFFLDLVKGLDYDAGDLIVDVEQLLADIYDIDTVYEKELAQSFAAYLQYLLGKPSLDWLYENKISYVCKRTALEWILGIDDPLLGYRKFPFIVNQTLASNDIDWTKDLFYAEQLGTYDVHDVGKIMAIANIPYYENSRSSDVIVEDDLAYILEGGTDIKIVNMTNPLFMAMGQYGDYVTTTEQALGSDGQILGFAVVDGFVYAVEGTRGLEVLNATNPAAIYEIDQWNNLGNSDMRDIDHSSMGAGLPFDALYIANGAYGITYARISDTIGAEREISTIAETKALNGTAIAIDVNDNKRHAYVALGTDGLNLIEIEQATGNLGDILHYNSIDFPNLKNVIDVKAKGSTVYVLDQVEGLLTFEVDFDGILTELGQFTYDPAETYFNNLYIDEDTARAYLTQGDYGFTIVSTSQPATLTESYRFNGTAHLGSAYGVFANLDDIYLADGSEGFIHLELGIGGTFEEIERDELHAFVECWRQDSKIRFNDWTLVESDLHFNETYDNFAVYPYAEKGLRQQWSEFFFRPFAYSSLTDTAIFYDQDVLVYTAQATVPLRQLAMTDIYWMIGSNYLNSSFIHVGRWNRMYDLDLKPSEFKLTHSLPGFSRDPFHMQNMRAEPITGSVIEREDRVQYCTGVQGFSEAYAFLNETIYGYYDVVNERWIIDPDELSEGDRYRTWHTTNPGLAGNMGTNFWGEDVHKASSAFYDYLLETFLNEINNADANRTIGAFAALFLVTIGFVIASVVLYRTGPKFKKS